MRLGTSVVSLPVIAHTSENEFDKGQCEFKQLPI